MTYIAELAMASGSALGHTLRVGLVSGLPARLTRLPPSTDRFAPWLASLEAKHLSELTFAEVSRSLRALSATYVERRQKLVEGAALSGRGKRAAFALFYGPLHHLLVTQIVRALPDATRSVSTLIDLGCGTGAAGAAWASALTPPPRIIGIDIHPWAAREAADTYRAFGVAATVRQGDIAKAPLPKGRVAILAAFTLNELPDAAREGLLTRLVERGLHGDRVLIVEPLAGGVARWWNSWRETIARAGGRADEWRFRMELPAIVAKLDRAAGLDHREITGRSLWLATSSADRPASS
jgi:SAM-dependent methyltransferase